MKNLNNSQNKQKNEHPSVAHRKKQEEARKLRLEQALRENLKKRKKQGQARKQSLSPQINQNKDVDS